MSITTFDFRGNYGFRIPTTFLSKSTFQFQLCLNFDPSEVCIRLVQRKRQLKNSSTQITTTQTDLLADNNGVDKLLRND